MSLKLLKSVIVLTFLVSNSIFLNSQVREPILLEPHLTIVNPYQSTVFIRSLFPGYAFRSSGSVVWQPYLIFMSAHSVYDSGKWPTSVSFSRALHSPVAPNTLQLSELRGFRVHASYASNASRFGISDSRTYVSDFAVGYGTATSNFGVPLPVDFSGQALLAQNGSQKMLMGYPARLDYSGRSGQFFMHASIPFTNALRSERDNYMGLGNFAVGPGFSGGPLVVFVNGNWHAAGILVSGNRTTIGVHAFNTASRNTALEAINAAGGITSAPTTPPTTLPPAAPPGSLPAPQPTPTPRPLPQPLSKTFVNNTSLIMPNGSSVFNFADLTVSDMPPYLLSAFFSILIECSARGDVDVYLRSPSGRITWVKKNNIRDRNRNFIVEGLNVSRDHRGNNPNGTWRVFMRDVFRNKHRAVFREAKISITSQ